MLPPDACVLRMFEFPQSIDWGSHTIDWGRPRGQIERRFRFVEFEYLTSRARASAPAAACVTRLKVSASWLQPYGIYADRS
eukprot:COSAG02_NODE_6294_length_3671_cov_32.343785_3_plen_81_part_00